VASTTSSETARTGGSSGAVVLPFRKGSTVSNPCHEEAGTSSMLAAHLKSPRMRFRTRFTDFRGRGFPDLVGPSTSRSMTCLRQRGPNADAGSLPNGLSALTA